jgi:hypothetical protein
MNWILLIIVARWITLSPETFFGTLVMLVLALVLLMVIAWEVVEPLFE